jgi:Fe2+ transport system protein B
MKYVSDLNRSVLLELAERKIYLEGNILKVLHPDEQDSEFNSYLNLCRERDKSIREKRLTVTKQVQKQNTELATAAENNLQLMEQLQAALNESKSSELDAIKSKQTAEDARNCALADLEIMQKKRQFELTGVIVKIALAIIVGVGLMSSIMYIVAIMKGSDSTIIESTWSNLFGILLTNSFSIVGTIMGIRYASKSEDMG